MFEENLNSPNINCPKCGTELQIVYTISKGELALIVIDFAFCSKCENFYKFTLQAVE